jgi:hypothetical protein
MLAIFAAKKIQKMQMKGLYEFLCYKSLIFGIISIA